VPLFPDVRREQELNWHALLEATPADAQIFRPLNREASLRTQLDKIIRRAGVRSLRKPFISLRASAACDLVGRYDIRTSTGLAGPKSRGHAEALQPCGR
jgi:hypothetical protein